MTVQITGPTSVDKTVGLTVSSSGCKSTLMSTQCTLTVPLKNCPTTKSCYKATVATYDAISGDKIPKSAHELSADQDFSFAITSGTTLIPLTLYGVPTSIAFIPSAGSSLTGTQKAGFIEPKCAVSTQRVSVLGVDAGGNYIIGVGAPAPSLGSDDAAQLAAAPVKSVPNTFTLTPPKSPAYPYGNHTVHLIAKITPAAQSGGKAQSLTVNVTYSGDICGTFTEFTLPPKSQPGLITTGPDGNLWFTECTANAIGRMTLNGKISKFKIPTAGSNPVGITVGPDKALWFTESKTHRIGRVTTTGKITEYALTATSSQPFTIATGPDKALWFIDESQNAIGRITTKGAITEYPVLTANSGPYGLAVADGTLWFTEASTNKIGQITTTGSMTETPIPVPSSVPRGIVAGPDGALWFAETNGNNIGRALPGAALTPTTITSEYPLPESASGPLIGVTGPDQALWFGETSGNRIARITTGGAIQEYGLPTTSAYPGGLTIGPDGALWFTEVFGNKIARLR